jgi:hypothetical protein
MMFMKNQKIEQVTEIESPATPLEKIDRSLSEVFNTEPMEVTEIIDDQGVVPAVTDNDVKTDHEFARGNMYSLLQQGNNALNYAIDLAKQTDSPRGFEVVATMMKSLADMNIQLMDLHDKKLKLTKHEKPEEKEPSKTVNNTVVFNGTTADINKILNNMKKEQ